MPNPKTSTLSTGIFWISLIVLSLAGILAVLYSTVWGAALSDDSYYYISSARDLLAGNGFTLVSNFPPLLPLVLSLIGIFKVDPLDSIRWLNAILFGVNIILVARIVYHLTRSYIFSLAGGFITMISSTFIVVHSWAMSEALFISLMLAGLLVYAAYHERDTWKLPFFTGLFFGLAAATRYIGVALLLAGGVFWLLEVHKSWQKRVRNGLIFSVIGVLPLFLWMIRNQLMIGQPTNRVFASHLMPLSLWVNMLNTVLLWILPGRLVHGKEMYWLIGIIFLATIVVSVSVIFSGKKRTKLE